MVDATGGVIQSSPKGWVTTRLARADGLATGWGKFAGVSAGS
ncbi:hypothetical protein NC99_06150 [Sunxiuqinia dokdonensis]|uniref:Uncharacterized protein n=1 Tax=Sunxiuqinia dokdonensis TaxID=1409788 RepID=A0A0L8VE76_9BACT|nr:hypothetical protein NC99_06150 [Sunxiuqinia dokdonensis]